MLILLRWGAFPRHRRNYAARGFTLGFTTWLMLRMYKASSCLGLKLLRGGLPLEVKTAYQGLLSNTVAKPTIRPDRRKSTTVYYEEQSMQQVWQFSIPQNKVATIEETLHLMEPARTFSLQKGTLSPMDTVQLPRHSRVKRIFVGRHVRTGGRGHTATKIADCTRIMSMAAQYEWRDGRQFFDTNTAHIRRLLTEIKPGAHK
jgi:hypothetical protein